MLLARAVLLILVLLAGSLSPPLMMGQVAEGGRSPPLPEPPGFLLEPNYPATVNPANPETWIPFTLSPTLFETPSQVTATIRIVNLLNQAVAIPEAWDHPAGRGTRVLNLVYTEPGRKLAYWDFRDTAGRRVPSGIYYVQAVVGRETPQTSRL